MLLDIIQLIIPALVSIHILWTFLTQLCSWYYFKRHKHPQATDVYAPSVSIIKPTKGIDQSALENFRSFCRQEYEGSYELIFCVEEKADPSVPLIEQIIREFPSIQIHLIFSSPGNNQALGKLKNMIAGIAASNYEIIIFSDSDARVKPSFLKNTVSCMGDASVGLGYAAPFYTGAENWPAALTGTSINDFTLRIATLSLFGFFHGAIGTTMIVRKSLIETIGGLGQLGKKITDDITLARLIHRRGYRVHLLREPVRVIHRYDHFGGWWAHMHRWFLIIRILLPLHFLLMNLADLGLWWALLHAVIVFSSRGSPIWALAPVLAVLALSIISAILNNLHMAKNGLTWALFWIVPLRELMRLPLIVSSCLKNEVTWRGNRLRVGPGGITRLVEKTERLS